MNKPDGITIIIPEMADEFIDKLPIRKFFGVGKVTEEKMLNLGIKPLLSSTETGKKKVRLLGISVSNFDDQDSVALKSRQLLLPLRFPAVADRKGMQDFKERSRSCC